MYLIHRPRKKLCSPVLEKSLLNSFPGASQQIGDLFMYRHRKNEFRNDPGSLSPQGVKALPYCNSEVLKFHYLGGERQYLFT